MDWESIKRNFRFRSGDRKSTRLNSSHLVISYAVFCLKKKKNNLSTIVHCKIKELLSVGRIHAMIIKLLMLIYHDNITVTGSELSAKFATCNIKNQIVI